MRDINRIDKITEKLSKLWKQSSDLRLGQLVSNLTYGFDIFHIEDDKLEQILDRELGKEKNNMKQFTKSDLKVGYLVRLANDKLCKLEQLQDGVIGLFDRDRTYVMALYNEDDDLENDLTSDLPMFTINEVYGYSTCGEIYDTQYRKLLWKRVDKVDMNFKKYKIKYGNNNVIFITPNYDKDYEGSGTIGYKTEYEDNIYLEVIHICGETASLSLSTATVKELIKSLQEIVDYVEGE